MKFVPKKATYSNSLIRNANDQDKATWLDTILDMAETSPNSQVVVTFDPRTRSYTFERSDANTLPDFVEPTVKERVDAMKKGETLPYQPNVAQIQAPRTLETDLREDR